MTTTITLGTPVTTGPFFDPATKTYFTITTTPGTTVVMGAANVVVTDTVTLTPSTTPPIDTPTTSRGVLPPPLQILAVAASNVVDQVQAASEIAQAAIEQCNAQLQTPARFCIADALDTYAAEIEKLAPQLPPSLRNVPDTLRKAAQKVRVAKTKAQAVQAVKAAIVEIRKSISLLRADDPVVREAGTREGAFVIQTLDVATNKLEKATGL